MHRHTEESAMNAWKVRLLLLCSAGLILAACTVTVAPAGELSPLAQPTAETPTAETPTAETPTAETPTDTPLATAAAAQPPMPTVSTPTQEAVGGVSVSGIPSNLLNRIFADASERTGVAPEALVVTRAEAVTWNDGSLGCPEPGMFYTMALVDGYQIVVDAEGKMLDYRVQSNGLFRLCERTLRGSIKP